MKNKILSFQIFSFIFVSIIGTLLHFVYEWSGQNSFIALFSAVNESTWEHLKLIFYPMLLTIIIGLIYFRKDTTKNFLCSKVIGILTAILFTIITFYTYTGVIGTNIDIVNILIFFVAVAVGEYVAYKIMCSNEKICSNKLALIILTLIFIAFIVFTFYPPKIGLFKDPIYNSYGIE